MAERRLDKDLIIMEGIEVINNKLSILIRLIVILLIIAISSIIWFLI
ncbi:MAG: hypothetical protein ACE5QW_07920 [Thermoplasmata archaeon]